MPTAVHRTPRLLGDIGSTYARFVLETAPGQTERMRSLRCADYPTFQAAVQAYLATLPPVDVQHAGIAIANPVAGDHVQMTNYHWQFSIESTREQLGLDTLVVVNDFTSLAMAIPRLNADEHRQVGGGAAVERSVIGLLGSGSGLGVSGLIPAEEGWISLGSEGGHTSFAPTDERELAILQHVWRTHPHVSFERLLSGSGIELMYRALAARAGHPDAPALPAPEITRRGLAGSDAVCRETIDAFCAMLGTAASNLAVTLGARGGIYIGGGIVPRLGAYFDRSDFRSRFETKGRFSDYLAAIPTYVITSENATFLGLAAIVDAQLRRMGSGSGSGMLDRVRRLRNNLPPAERRVADLVLSHARLVLGEPIADIARRAEVSQPTVIRFCRSLGCEGLSDFKLRLASGLSGTVPVSHTQVTGDDSALELGAKVLGNTASAILQVRDNLNRESIDRAIDLLLNRNRIEFYAVGHYGVVAQDAQFKFLRFGISCVAYTDPRLQHLAAAVLTEREVVVVISPSGRIADLNEAVDKAIERGAAVVAITSGQSPLARKASVALLVDHSEDVATQMPMVSRILHLLIIDILAVGVAMRRTGSGVLLTDPDAATDEVAAPAGTQPAADAGPAQRGRLRIPKAPQPGVVTSAPLSRLTSHSR